AIYTLNQKRRELARIERDYQMSITFEPKEGLMVGTFEIERTAQKTPEESAKLAAAFKTEFVPPPAEEEPEEIVEAEEADEIEETEAEAPQHQGGQQQPQQPGSSKRRRRRRGGRGHSGGERPPQPHGQQSHQHHQPAPQPSLAPEGESAPAADVTASSVEAPSGIEGQPGAPRKKRRRRRGKRGGSSNRPTDQLGEPMDAMNTSVRSNGTEHEPIPSYETQIVRPEVETPVAMPNGSSTPVWSLTGEHAQTVSHASGIIAEPIAAPEPEAPAPAAEPVPQEPPQPPKKGWWQRTFRSEE
ncbi:MAG TPA: hypothetical protein VFV07_08045, partial [Rhizomicrobium sp.]|nr:hypothetical protein [Rhizomicrobium sp.]